MIRHWVVTFDSVMSPVRGGASTFIGTDEEAKKQLQTLMDTHTWKEDGDTLTIYTSTGGWKTQYSATHHPTLGWMWE